MRRAVASVFVVLAVAAASAAPARADDFVVTKPGDANDGTCDVNNCSLRDAIKVALANGPGNHVVLTSGVTYTLSIPPSVPDVPGSGDLDITGALTIDGHGSTIDGGGLDRVLDIQGDILVTLNDVTIQNGSAKGTLSLGGGIRILGATVVLNNCTVTGNKSNDDAGSEDPGGGIAVIGSYDAGVVKLAGLTFTNSRVIDNQGSNGGGIACVLCTLTATGSVVDTNTASETDGGGVMLVGDKSDLSIVSSDVAGNGSAVEGGGISVPFGTGTASIDRSRIAANTAPTGSAIYNVSAAIAATNNWWGCNSGAGGGGNGCDGSANGVSGPATVEPYLKLRATATPLTTVVGGTSEATADLRFNSEGPDGTDTSPGGTLRDGIKVDFSATHGGFASTTSDTVAGKATDVFSAETPGTAALSAKLDGQTESVSVNVACQAISIDPATLPVAVPNVPYPPVTLIQTGAIGTATFTVTTGAPPAGMNLSGAGVLSGTPTVPGPVTFTVTVTDSNGCTGTRTYTLTVACPPMTITPPTLPRAEEFTAYSAMLTVPGAKAPVTFTQSSGSLPMGFGLSPAGVISGGADARGSFTFGVHAADANSCTADATFTIPVTRQTITLTGPGAGGAPVLRGFDSKGALLGSLFADDPSFTGGVRVAIGDVNGDGVLDIVTGRGPGTAPVVRVFDGASQTITLAFDPFDASFTGGVYVAVGDVNGDGRADIIVGSGQGSIPVVRVFDGVTGALMRSFNPYVLGFTGGVRVAAGDVNGDGYADIITGAAGGATPHVEVFDGASNALLASFFAYGSAFTGGVYVAAGDVNGDGFADVITGAGPGGGPHVQVFDLHNGTTLQSFYAYTPGFGGGVRVAAGDINGDGHADVITAPGAGGGPHVRVWDGVTGEELTFWFAYDFNFLFGVFVAGQGPLNRMAVDGPGANSAIPGTFTVSGWALQEASRNDPGISTIHVWALPTNGAPGTFLGVATLGDQRPDVAAVFGGEYVASGYHLNVAGLAPGVYDLIVFVNSSTSHLFNDRRVVRVTVQ